MPERRAWSQEEDAILKRLREQFEIVKWSVIAKKMAQEYDMPDRTGKQCRERYHNHLDSTILRTEWSPQQENYLYQLHDEIGNKWAIIAQKLPGRTDNCVKNHFYSKMRKAIRKLNKAIYQYFKKEIKQIKMTVLYKIIQATDQRFKSSPNVEEELSTRCCIYSNDNNPYENDTEKLGEMARQIHDFSSRYRRKPKKTRRPSAQGTDLLRLPKFQHKVKSDVQDDDSEYSIMYSHGGDESQQSYQIDDLPKKIGLQAIKEQLKQSTNSKMDGLGQSQQMSIQIKNTLMMPPVIMKPPCLPNHTAQKYVESGDRVQEFLRNQGLLENSLQFTGNIKNPNSSFKYAGLRVPSLKGDLTQSIQSNQEEFCHGTSFLSQSIQKIRISDMNFDVELDEEHKLFISN